MTLVSPATDPNSTTIEVWVQADDPDGVLRPGTTVHLSMVAQSVPNALIIPSASLLASDGKTTVMIVGADSKAHQQEVAVGIRNGDEVRGSTSGLKAGDTVVTNGAFGLPDNTRVQVEKPSPEQVPSGRKV